MMDCAMDDTKDAGNMVDDVMGVKMSQKEQLEADIGKDVVGLFPTSSSKADELSDSDVPDLDYMDCFASISKECAMVTETLSYDPHMRYPSGQSGISGGDGDGTGLISAVHNATSGGYNRNFPGFNNMHGAGYMTDMNYPSPGGYDGSQPCPQDYSPDYNSAMHLGGSIPPHGSCESMWLVQQQLQQQQQQQQYSSDPYYTSGYQGSSSQSCGDYRGGAVEGPTVPGSLPSNYSAGTSPGTPGNVAAHGGNLSPSPPRGMMYNAASTAPGSGFNSPDLRCVSAGGSSDVIAMENRPTNGKTRTKDKYRIVYTEYQRKWLEEEFLKSRYITIRRKAELSRILSLTERQVKIWFQNRRAKERKKLKEVPPTAEEKRIGVVLAKPTSYYQNVPNSRSISSQGPSPPQATVADYAKEMEQNLKRIKREAHQIPLPHPVTTHQQQVSPNMMVSRDRMGHPVRNHLSPPVMDTSPRQHDDLAPGMLRSLGSSPNIPPQHRPTPHMNQLLDQNHMDMKVMGQPPHYQTSMAHMGSNQHLVSQPTSSASVMVPSSIPEGMSTSPAGDMRGNILRPLGVSPPTLPKHYPTPHMSQLLEHNQSTAEAKMPPSISPSSHQQYPQPPLRSQPGSGSNPLSPAQPFNKLPVSLPVKTE